MKKPQDEKRGWRWGGNGKEEELGGWRAACGRMEVDKMETESIRLNGEKGVNCSPEGSYGKDLQGGGQRVYHGIKISFFFGWVFSAKVHSICFMAQNSVVKYNRLSLGPCCWASDSTTEISRRKHIRKEIK
ncbi:hypothetical protein AVEN_196134-1 [Araneus ventricosus]|uniref:Uncharacterized protein n=1 Tax=Araneus ventricosus TaxID=182803 RepID=A0A4Y2E4L9_ARAVE|nr:hypothetical protein AVEN_196134-1 [Araneus ventricosus]